MLDDSPELTSHSKFARAAQLFESDSRWQVRLWLHIGGRDGFMCVCRREGERGALTLGQGWATDCALQYFKCVLVQ